MTVELSLRAVRAGFGPVEVLHGISLDVPSGVVTALIGPNGAGKTTALGVIAGLVAVRAGQLRWRGQDISSWTVHQRSAAGLTLIPDRSGIFPELSVRDNLTVFAAGAGDDAQVSKVFPVLADRMDQPAGTLSGGQQQMLALSRALVRRPELLLIDELSAGLAPQIARTLFEVVSGLAAGGTTVLLVEQHRSVALRLADVVYVLERGQVSFAGEPAELADQVAG
jgi:branched-chain amino acid transport system ATP-binding protein